LPDLVAAPHATADRVETRDVAQRIGAREAGH
jgi:hypothetical protein